MFRRTIARVFIIFIPLIGAAVFYLFFILYGNSFGINHGIGTNVKPNDPNRHQCYYTNKTVEPNYLTHTTTPNTPSCYINPTYANDMIYRIVWSISLLALTCCLCFSIGTSYVTIFYGLEGIRLGFRIAIITVITLAGAVFWYRVADINLSGGIGDLLYEIAANHSNPELHASCIMNPAMASIVFASWLYIVACCAICRLSFSTEQYIQLRLARLFRFNLGITALLLCVGIVQTFALFNWLCHFLACPSMAQFIRSGMVLSISAFYTILFLVVFMPTYLIWKEGTLRWAKEAIADQNDKSPKEYLQEHGIKFSFRNLVNLMSILTSPLTLGLLTELLKPLL